MRTLKTYNIPPVRLPEMSFIIHTYLLIQKQEENQSRLQKLQTLLHFQLLSNILGLLSVIWDLSVAFILFSFVLFILFHSERKRQTLRSSSCKRQWENCPLITCLFARVLEFPAVKLNLMSILSIDKLFFHAVSVFPSSRKLS